MVPEDPEAARPAKPRTHAGSDAPEAFAATVGPADVPSPLGAIAASSTGTTAPDARRTNALESDQTIGAPMVSAYPPLPTIAQTRYQTDKEIARGGMGRIIAATDQRLGRPVALKELLEPVPEQIGRFEREALITARLQHPGIVPVYEAGRWPSGEPFFAMKLVSGRPLDRVIAETKTFEQRLALLPRIAAAADAMAYAHNQRVIHRDLKPGNVLIGDFGETVVIDWGLAKDLDIVDGPESGQRVPRPAHAKPDGALHSGSSTLTVAGAVLGTPAYMAPEQARGEPLDQRADVFALGAMLYHLLAGVPPYNARTATDVIAAAALGRVVPLLEREHAAPKDLVAIVERAMAQVPADRYPHAGELADELRRFLTGQLVDAHRYTALQKVGRFVKKHRAAVTISLLSIIAFAVFGTLAVHRIVDERDAADRERQIAVTRRQAAEKLIDKMLSDVKDRLTQIGRLDLLSNLGGEIRDYYNMLAKMPGGMPPEDSDRMASAVDLVGQAERDSGRLDQALKTWTGARTMLALLVGTDTGIATQSRRRMIARLDYQIGTVHQLRGKIAAAITSYTLAKREFDALKEQAPNDRGTLLQAAETHDRLGDLLRNEGKVEEALDEYSEAKGERERAGSQASSRPSEEVLALSTSHVKLGSVYQARGESAKALEEYKAALRLRETLREAQPDNVEVLEKVLDVQDNLAELERVTGDCVGALETYREAVTAMDGLAQRDPSNTTWKRNRANLFANLGFALSDVGEFKNALDQYDHAIALQLELAAHDPKGQAWQGDLGRTYTRSGDAKIYLGDLAAGFERYQQALEIRKKLVASDPKSSPYRRAVAWSFAKLGNAFLLKGEPARVIEFQERALAIRTRLVEESPGHSGFRNELAATEVVLARMVAPKDPERAEKLVTSSLARVRTLVSGDPINTEWKETLTQALLAQAEVARLRADPKARHKALLEAMPIAHGAADHSPQSAIWPGYVAEIHAALAELASTTGDPSSAGVEWKAVRDALEPLAKQARLPWPRKNLLDRARAGR